MTNDDVPARSTRDKILIAAATMLGEDPTARLSVRAVAARAGVNTGSLRHFFPTQRLLVDTVIAGMYDLSIPDDPIHEYAATPTQRLVACLQQLLEQVGTGERARQHLRATYETYVASNLSADEEASYFALERLGSHIIERWLSILADEGSASSADIEQSARFLSTVIAGLSIERALPGSAARLAFETTTLTTAAGAVLTEKPTKRAPTAEPDQSTP